MCHDVSLGLRLRLKVSAHSIVARRRKVDPEPDYKVRLIQD